MTNIPLEGLFALDIFSAFMWAYAQTPEFKRIARDTTIQQSERVISRGGWYIMAIIHPQEFNTQQNCRKCEQNRTGKCGGSVFDNHSTTFKIPSSARYRCGNWIRKSAGKNVWAKRRMGSGFAVPSLGIVNLWVIWSEWRSRNLRHCIINGISQVTQGSSRHNGRA